MERVWKIAIALVTLCAIIPGVAKAQVGYGVERHVFSAETGRPLPGAIVELHIFSQFFPDEQLAIGTETDDGGFYRLKFTPILIDKNGEDAAVGYAFAYSCRGVVQIVPLYTKLHPGRFYSGTSI